MNEGRFIEQPAEAQVKADFTLKANIRSVKVEPSTKVIEPAPVDESKIPIAFTNRFGSFIGGVGKTSLGSALFAQPTLTDCGRPQIYEIDIPEGTAKLSVQIKAALTREQTWTSISTIFTIISTSSRVRV